MWSYYFLYGALRKIVRLEIKEDHNACMCSADHDTTVPDRMRGRANTSSSVYPNID